jgi:integrase
MHAYIALSLLAGTRTEEARALRWAHIDLDGGPAAGPPVPPHAAVWRSVRARGETKTERSRRTLALPAAAVQALRAWTGSLRLVGVGTGAGMLRSDALLAERPAQSVDAARPDPPGQCGFRSECLCRVVGTGIDVQLGRDSGLHEPRCEHDVLIPEQVHGPHVDEGRRQAGQVFRSLCRGRTRSLVVRHEQEPAFLSGSQSLMFAC